MVEPNEVVRVLFESFCECCELGEEGCIRPSPEGYGIRCPAFDAVQAVCSDNPFVRRILGRYMQCRKCGHLGMVLPASTCDTAEEPLLYAPTVETLYGDRNPSPHLVEVMTRGNSY